MNKTEKIAIILVIILVIGSISYILINPMDNTNTNTNDYKLETFEVINGTDDSRTFTVELNEKGYENENGAWAYLQINPTYSFGIKLRNITIPKNAKIIDCYVELYSIGGPGMRHPNCKIYFDKVENATSFNDTIGVLNISGRIYSENYSIWNETVGYQEWVKTPSLKDQMQEIINQKNWSYGNSVAVLFVSQKLRGYVSTFQHFEKGFPPRLIVKWK